MASGFDIEIKGLEEATKRLEKMGKDVRPTLASGMSDSLAFVHRKTKYPPVVRRPQPFKSDRSRRFFFAALKRGIIRVPYRRGQPPQSQKLGQSITTHIETTPNEVIGKIGTNVSYAPLVIGEKTQATYHKGNWWTLEGKVRESLPQIQQIFRAKINQLLKG